jgi:hypothetical protein
MRLEREMISNLRASVNGAVIRSDERRYHDARRVLFTAFPPGELSVIANVLKARPLPFRSPGAARQSMVMSQMVYAGGPVAGEKAMAPIRALATPLEKTLT